MPAPMTAWGLDIGQCALKAVKLRDVEGEIQVDAFDIVEHPKVLTQPDADRDQLIRNALEQFLARNNVEGSRIAVSVPGQSSFTRFIKLPPVENRKIPDIVRFEAEQQIPFPIDDVIWRWQTFQEPDSPDVELGIFAMKRVDVSNVLRHFNEVELSVDVVQMAPLALYNFMTFDEQRAGDGATLLADVGADKTDLVVADGSRIWTRTLQIGGNNFTEALVRAFKLSFPKAEKLKRTAASSKYARQIFQTMRPVFADFQQEVQRSIGYYTSLHRDTRFRKVVGLGNGFRLPGLQKFLEQNLNLPVARVDSFNRVTPSSAVNAPGFNENVPSLAVAYGLAVQGLDESAITTSLLPGEVSRHRRWQKKRPWFAAAAAVLVGALAMLLISEHRTTRALAETKPTFEHARALAGQYEDQYRQYQSVNRDLAQPKAENEAILKMFAYRNFWPAAQSLIFQSLGRVASHQSLYNAVARLQDDMHLEQDPQRKEQLQQRLQALGQQLSRVPREDRMLLFVEQVGHELVADVTEVDRDKLENYARRALGMSAAAAEAPQEQQQPMEREGSMEGYEQAAGDRPTMQQAEPKRGYVVTFICRTPMKPPTRVDDNMILKLDDAAEEIVQSRGMESVGFVEFARVYHPDPRQWQPEYGGSEGRSRSDRRRSIPRRRPRRSYRDEEEPSRRFSRGGQEFPARRGGETDEPVEQILVPDPVFRGEDMVDDNIVAVSWLISIEGDGVDLPDAAQNEGGR